MPARVETTSAIGTAPAACDVYDMDNIFLTDEGWVYRHYKKADKSQFWDEILVAGEVVAGATIGGVANAPVDAINDPAPNFEAGDGVPDYVNSPLYGGVDPAPTPPADPDTVVGVVTVTGNTNVNDGDSETYSVDTGNATASNLTYAWTADDDATISGDATGSTVTVNFAYNSGNATVSVVVGSDDPNFDGSTGADGLAIAVAAPAPAGPDVTLTLTGADGTDAYTSDSGNNPGVTVTVGQILAIVNNSGGHPVDVLVSDGGAQVSEGTLTGAPAGNGDTLTWDTTGVTPGTYYYQCTSHSTMIGTITVSA